MRWSDGYPPAALSQFLPANRDIRLAKSILFHNPHEVSLHEEC